MESVRPEFIVDTARSLQDIDLPPERAQALAAEVAKLNADILALGSALRVSDEPAAFAIVLAEPPR